MRVVRHLADARASARQSKTIKLRQPVSTILIVADKSIVKRTVRTLRQLLLQQANAKDVRVGSLTEEERLKKLIVEPNFKALGPAFRGETNNLAKTIGSLYVGQLVQPFREEVHFAVRLDDMEYMLT